MKVSVKKIVDAKSIDDTYVQVDKETLDQMVKSFRDFLKKQYRNVPVKSQPNYFEYAANGSQYVHRIIQLTTDLIEQEVITEDPYGFLNKNVKTFDPKYVKSINTDLIPMALEVIKKEHQKITEQKESLGEKVTTLEKELTATDIATIVQNPTENEETSEITSVSGKKFTFNKTDFTLSYRTKDGTIKVIKIAPKGTWRATALNFFSSCIKWIVTKYTNTKNRCIGVKQVFRFKYEQFKFNRKAKESSSNAFDSLEPISV